MFFLPHIWNIISSKLDYDTWYITQLTSKHFHLDTDTQLETHYKNATRRFVKKLLKMITNPYLNECGHRYIILPFDLDETKKILLLHLDVYEYDYGVGVRGPTGPRGERGARGLCGLPCCDSGWTCPNCTEPPCVYCTKPKGMNMKCPICRDEWNIPFDLPFSISIENPPKFKYTPEEFQTCLEPLIKTETEFEWDDGDGVLFRPHARFSIKAAV